MKNILIILSLTCISLVAGCSSENDDSNVEAESEVNNAVSNENQSETGNTENLYSVDEVEEGYWIGQSGHEVQNPDMVITSLIDFDPNLDYEMNDTAYVTYYNGDEILNTVLHSEGNPVILEKNDQADGIRISFNKKKRDDFKLYTK